jgi:hypothetical protein
MSIRHRCYAWFVVWFVALVATGAPAGAQYFGTNKVQYKSFDFQVLRTEHFDVYFYPSEREGSELAARMAERWHDRLSRFFDHSLRGRQPLVLYASHPDFEQTNVIQGELGQGTGGVTEPIRRRIVMPLGGPLADTDHVIGHELVHAFQFDITMRRDRADGGRGLAALPLWFVEGMAEYASIGPVSTQTAMWLRDAARKEELPDMDDLADTGKYFPYRWGHAFWAYVAGRWGDSVVPRMLDAAAVTGDVNGAVQRVLGVSAKELSAAWQASIRTAYAPVLAAGTPPDRVGRALITPATHGGEVNVGPALSPDGRWVAFLSEQQDLFSIDLYVAEVATGRILRRLTRTASDPHYSSLQFIQSAGAWDATSRRIAAATVTNGRPALTVFDAASGAREAEIVVDGVDEIFNPTFGPDGQAIAFAGLSGGLTDLYVYDLARRSLRRLTSDAYADIQPVWSPDGRRIAFATDRFTSRLDQLQFGAYRLALIDPATGIIEPVRTFDEGQHINPQWSGDSRSLIFIADRDGIPNLYRATLGGGVEQLSTVGTGLSGITPSSPALSVAANGARAAVSVFDDSNYSIHLMELPAQGTALAAALVPAGALPPINDRMRSALVAILQDTSTGLPPAAPPEVRPYSAALGLEAVAQPSISVGASRFGAAFGAGLSLTFSDLLNNHVLATAVQLNSGISGGFSIDNSAVQVGYINQANRWNVGVVGGRVPYVSGYIQTGLGTYQGAVVGIDETTLFRQIENAAAGLAAYPLNRARRVEVQGGVTQIVFDQIVRTDIYSPVTGQLLLSRTNKTSTGDPLILGTSSVAFVSDTSSFGATSPVFGERYRLEAAPTFGTLNFTSVLGDYRRYIMPVPLYTVAGRLLHYGRYGGGSSDPRLYPLYLGQPTLVRGYDVGSFSANECVPNAVSGCPVFDRLLGNRLLVGNVEFRFPLLRPFKPARQSYGFLPVEAAVFADGGVAWHTPQSTTSLSGADGVASVGATFRVNLFGSAVLQFDIVRPLQRPRAGVVYQFNLTPGF